AEPADLHGDVGVLAVHANREASGLDDRITAEGGERAGDHHDAVDQALAEARETELEQGLERAQVVKPGHMICPWLLHGTYAAEARMADPRDGQGRRVWPHDPVRADPHDTLGPGARQPAIERRGLPAVRCAQDGAPGVPEVLELGPRDLRGVVG